MRLLLEFSELQRKEFSASDGSAIRRRTLEARIVALEKENTDLRQQLDGWIERWVAVEYNAKLHGIDADLIFAPIPPPQRKILTFRGRKKSK